MTPETGDRKQEPRAGKRRRGREMALQILFQRDLAGGSPLHLLSSFDVGSYATETSPSADPKTDEQAFEYARRLVEGTVSKEELIDQLLAQQAENWRIERMAAVDRNVLRLAIYELLYEEDVPKVVVVNEAIELAKKFGSEKSGAFVNGLLDALMKSQPFPGKMY